MKTTLKRRRHENKTDYAKRIRLLKSGTPRVVFRKTNRYIIAQYVTSKEAQDKIEMDITSKDLLKYGWPKEAEGSLKSITASYLTGLLIGKKILNKKLKTPIIDIGMIQSLHKTKVFAFLKGIKDSGLDIKTDEKTFPEEERIKGESLKGKISFDEIKSKVEKE